MTASAAATQILFVTGKGGVGKSSVSLAYALKFADEGYRTLLVEMGSRSYFADFLHTNLDYTPRNLSPNLDAVCWAGEQCLREYVLHYLKIERVYKIFFENRVMRALLDVAPGLKEISLLGKITSGIRHIGPKLSYERVVVDTFATGHAISFFQTPKALSDSIGIGPMGEQSRSIERVLRDPALSQYVIVTLLEELPVTESEELARELQKILGVTPQVIANKVLSFDPAVLQEVNPAGEDFVKYLQAILNRQSQYRQRLKKSTNLVCELPQYFGSDPWQMARTLKDKLHG